MGISTLLTNTILVPYHDSLVDSHPLQPYDVTENISSLKNADWNTSKNYAVYIKVGSSQAVPIIYIQEFSGFGMTREVEQKTGVSRDYVVNLPGPIKYSDVTIRHIFTRDHFFLNWLTTGATIGGATRADIEIHLIPTVNKKLIFTLYDAFPIDWQVDKLDAGNATTALMETITLTYSKVSFTTQPILLAENAAS